MEYRTVTLVLRLLQRHLPAPIFKQSQSHLPRLLPRDPLPFDASVAGAVAGKHLLDFVGARGGGEAGFGGGFSDVEWTGVGGFCKQPNSPFLAFDRASSGGGSLYPSTRVGVGAGGLGVEVPEPVWRFELGVRLKSGMFMPTQREEEEVWEASSVKRKRKKKMNKHKQRKLRRRDRHRN